MKRIRLIETRIAEKYKEGLMRCPVHLSIGQEAVPVGVCKNLGVKDQVLSAHRSHAHYLAKGGSLKSMLSELYGKSSGCAGGKGGSMHLLDLSKNFLAAVPIVGSTIPMAVGASWGRKLQKITESFQIRILRQLGNEGARQTAKVYIPYHYRANPSSLKYHQIKNQLNYKSSMLIQTNFVTFGPFRVSKLFCLSA